eukprot:3731548-Amphidinium_carterae.1
MANPRCRRSDASREKPSHDTPKVDGNEPNCKKLLTKRGKPVCTKSGANDGNANRAIAYARSSKSSYVKLCRDKKLRMLTRSNAGSMQPGLVHVAHNGLEFTEQCMTRHGMHVPQMRTCCLAEKLTDEANSK